MKVQGRECKKGRILYLNIYTEGARPSSHLSPIQNMLVKNKYAYKVYNNSMQSLKRSLLTETKAF